MYDVLELHSLMVPKGNLEGLRFPVPIGYEVRVVQVDDSDIETATVWYTRQRKASRPPRGWRDGL